MSSSWSDQSSYDTGGYSGTSSIPTLPDDIDLGSLAPVFGVMGNNSDVDYLDFDIKGRSKWQSLVYNTGTFYLGGLVGGGSYGFFNGLKNSPSPKFKIRLNTVLNACGKNGSKLANSMGMLALIYSTFEAVADAVEIDTHLGEYDSLIPVTAGAATGMLYKSTAGSRPMMLAGLIGAGIMAGITAGNSVFHFRY